jgi:antitoxin YefM
MAVRASEARRNLAHLIDRVNLDHTAVEMLVETSYLLRSPRNAHRLMWALGSVRDGTSEQQESRQPRPGRPPSA